MNFKIKPSDVLKLARETIADPAHWTQGVNARNAEGEVVSAYEDEAVCFCSMGAILRAWVELNTTRQVLGQATASLNDTVSSKGASSIVSFNDRREHKEVLAAFDNAIAHQIEKEKSA